jgi:hypothetical protein
MTQLVKASTQLATTLGIEPAMMIETIKAQCFPNMRPEQISDAQLAAFVSVANTLDLNPLIPGMLYAYPQRNGGITPVTGPDGTFKKLGEMKGVTYECEVFPDDVTQKPTHAKACIYVEGKERPHTYTALFSEWCVGNNPNWQTRPRHMLWLRALKQCARQVIHGLPMDEDEIAIAGLKNVTPVADEPAAEAPMRQSPPKRERGVAAAKAASQAPTVEAEIVPPAETKAAAPAKPAEQTATPAPVELVKEAAPAAEPEKQPEKKVEPAKPAPAPEKKTEPVKQSPAPAAAASVKQLADGQRITFERLDVERFAKKTINGQPSIEAELKGAYTGKAYHIGGAEHAAWQIEKPVTATLVGKKLTSGTVITLVEKLEVSAEADGLSLE